MLHPNKVALNPTKSIGIMIDEQYGFFIPENKKTFFWTIDIPSFNDLNENSVILNNNHDISTTKRDQINSAELWHVRLGNPGRGVYEVASKMADLPRLPLHEARVCPTCALSKGK